MYEYNATVTRVIDGDTISADVDSGFYVHVHITFRLIGVNCPEVHGDTKAAGLEAAAYTRATLLGKTVRIRTAKSDSFGRWLVQIYVDGLDFNQSLVDRGLAVPYMVGKFAGPGAAGESGPLSEPWHERLVFDPDVSEQSPVVKGTWVTVGHVVSLIVDGWTWSDIMRAHPELSEDDIRSCLAYTIETDTAPAGEVGPGTMVGEGEGDEAERD